MGKLHFAQTATGVLAISALLNVAFRFLPTSAYTFRAWESMTLGRDSVGAFRSGSVYDCDGTYGDIAGLANLYSSRQYRRERFTTDRCGNRNPPSLLQSGESIDVMLIGTSYISGSGLNDDETLSARLSQATGLRVYNAAGVDIQNFRRVAEMAREIRLRSGGTILLDLIDRSPDLKVCAGCESPPPTVREELCPPVSAKERWKNRIKVATEVSPLSIYGQSFRKWLESTGWFPNPARESAIERTLTNGQAFFVLRKEVGETLRVPHDPAPQRAFVAAFRKYLAARGYALKILMVPNKSELYAPLLTDADSGENRALAKASYLTELAEGLRADGVPTVDLLEPMRQAAREALSQRKLLYWADDTHWNAEGVRVAADALGPLVKSP